MEEVLREEKRRGIPSSMDGNVSNHRKKVVYRKIPQEDSLRVKYKLCEIVR